MKKRAVIVHGWDGHPEEGWFPWLKSELEKNDFEVQVPQMPETDKPRIYNWVPKLSEVIGVPDENLYLIGHSMGCQTIVRYVRSLPEGIKIGGAVFVAGFFKRLTGLEDDEEVQETDKHWLTAPLDLTKVKDHMKKSVAIFSDNDPFVPADNIPDYENILGSKIVIEHDMNHFSGSEGVVELPSVLNAILEISSN